MTNGCILINRSREHKFIRKGFTEEKQSWILCGTCVVFSETLHLLENKTLGKVITLLS